MKRSLSLWAAVVLAGCAAGQKTTMEQAISANVTEKVKSDMAGPKRRIGIVDFENKTAYGQGRLGGAAADVLITELAKTGKFIVVEREKVNKLLEEQKLAATGAVDPDTAAKMGKLLGLNAIVTGAISNFGVSTTGADYLIAQRKKQVAQVTIDVRVVDAETGQVLYADSGKGESQSSKAQVLGMGTQGGYEETLEGEALRASISQLALNITSQVNKKEWSCRVADAQGGDVYLDAGQDSGLKIGARLAAYKLGREIKSPTTGLVIGRTQQKVGELEITEYFGDNGAKAKVVDGGAPGAGDLAKLLR